MIKLKRGDPCPCCGQPIKTDDPDALRLLGWIAEHGYLPTRPEVRRVLDRVERKRERGSC